MSNGILLIAAGHQWFGRMAHNLAVALKTVAPETQIALVWAGDAMKHLTVFDLSKTFDHIIEAPAESFTRNGKTEWIKMKTFMYDLSPFDETIFLDADMIWLATHNPAELFNEFRGIDFTIQSSSKHIEWADQNEVRKEYELTDNPLLQVSSEFVYFKKTEKVKELFDLVKFNYDNIKVKYKEFSGGIPDELPFAIAMMQLKIYPHKKDFVPIYWHTREKNIPNDLFEKYYAISAGGKIIGDWTKNIYNRLVQHYFNKADLRNIWKLQNKRSFLPERSLI